MTEGLFFALLATISWSICIFPFTTAARRIGNNELNHFRLILASVILAILCLLTNAEMFTGLFNEKMITPWIWFGISGVIGLTVGDYFAFRMYSILGARTGSVLTTFAPAGALVAGALLIGERISFIGITGIIITIVGVIQISLGRSERKNIFDHGHGKISNGIIAGILAALCQGTGLALAKKGFLSAPEVIHPLGATFMRLLSATAGLYIVSFLMNGVGKVYKRIAETGMHGIRPALAGTIFGPVLAVLLSLFTVARLEPSVAQTIFSLVPVFALFISAVFMKEIITQRSVTGVIVAIAGVMILIWRDALDSLA